MKHGATSSILMSKEGDFVTMSDMIQTLSELISSPIVAASKHVYSSIHEAVKYGSTKGCQAYKADINTPDEYGDAPLHIAVSNEQYDCVSFLIKNGADLEKRNKLGQSAFHLATVLKNPKMMKLLFQKRANVESRNNSGQTPLHFSIYAGNENIVEILLKDFEALPDALTDSNPPESALDIAEKCRRDGIVNLLNLYMAPRTHSALVFSQYPQSQASTSKGESFDFTKAVEEGFKNVWAKL